MNITLPPEIVVKGGKDVDGSWGTGKSFTREFYRGRPSRQEHAVAVREEAVAALDCVAVSS